MISTYAQLLKMKYGAQMDQPANQYMDYMVEGTHRLESLIQGMLAFSRVANLENSPHSRISLNSTIRWALENLTAAVSESGAVIEAQPLGTVTGNQIQLTQLFQNLLSNAIKYRAEGDPPRIQIYVERRGDNIVTIVEDNGIGVPPEYHDRIFGLFKRLGRDKSGTGIGLALCKKVVEKHRGRIWVEPAPVRGSRFCVALPGHEIEQY
jgi:light-regulated signal transduction histidine kinase (bacteriophytochrome)